MKDEIYRNGKRGYKKWEKYLIMWRAVNLGLKLR